MQLNKIEDKVEELAVKYPFLYRITDDNRRTPFGYRGRCAFDIGPGWYDLLDGLSAKLTELFSTLPLEEWPTVHQVKEKFAEIRVYIGAIEDEDLYKKAHILIDEATVKSRKTCEECGQPGKIRSGSWLKTLCDTCADGREEHFFEKPVTEV